jgi:peroxiredoxin/uncharacterized membrane protein YphA (DoxX/SURF4 family)
MATTLLIVRLALATVFAVAGTAKLTDRAGVRAVAAEFGAPGAALAPLAWVLAAAELIVALALVVDRRTWIGALGALVLLVAFTAVVIVNVARGRRPSCHCFGRLHASRIGWSTVARNTLLGSLAGFVLAGGHFPLAFAALALAAVVAWAALERRGGAPGRPGAPASSFALQDQRRRSWTLEALLARQQPLLLLFSAPGCGACEALVGDVADWQNRLAGKLTVVTVSSGSREQNLALAHEHALRLVLEDAGAEVTRSYGIEATPSAVLVGGDGTLAAAPAVGAEEIAALVAQVGGVGTAQRLARRALLTRAVAGAAALTVLPMISSAASAARTVGRAVRPGSLKIEGAFLCDQRYALCTRARCVPSKSDPKIAVCSCKVTHGYSVGFKSCEARAQRGSRLHSNFSLQDVNSKTRALKCSGRGLWAQCLDVVCQIDPDHPDRAECQCVRMETKDFYTFAGDCDTDTCSTVLWSATTAPFPGGAQYEKGMKQLGFHVELPKACPTGAKPAG